MNTAVLINCSANNGGAKIKWLQIEKMVKAMLPPGTFYIPYETPCNLDNVIKSLISNFQVRHFIAAGGDGSVNYLINALARLNNLVLSEFCIGAIGLGSSNDFHKPVKHKIKNVPVKINFSNKKYADTGIVNYSGNGQVSKRLFIINASLGFTAEGNYLFNKGDKIIRFLKFRSTNLAIFWTVLKTFIKYKNISLQIACEGAKKEMNVTNLSIAKNPNISGSFSYDLSTEPDSGKLGFYLAENLNKTETLRLLYQLTKNRFSEFNKCCVKFIQNLVVKSESNIAIETDGEIFMGKHFHFSVLPKAISIAG